MFRKIWPFVLVSLGIALLMLALTGLSGKVKAEVTTVTNAHSTTISSQTINSGSLVTFTVVITDARFGYPTIFRNSAAVNYAGFQVVGWSGMDFPNGGPINNWGEIVMWSWPGDILTGTITFRAIQTGVQTISIEWAPEVVEVFSIVVYQLPVILNILPESALPNDPVQIWGRNFVCDVCEEVAGTVKFYGEEGIVVTSEAYFWWDDNYSMRLPGSLIPSRNYSVTVEREGVESEPYSYTLGSNPSAFNVQILTKYGAWGPKVVVSGTVKSLDDIWITTYINEEQVIIGYVNANGWNGTVDVTAVFDGGWTQIRYPYTHEKFDWSTEYCVQVWNGNGSYPPILYDYLGGLCVTTPIEPYRLYIPLTMKP